MRIALPPVVLALALLALPTGAAAEAIAGRVQGDDAPVLDGVGRVWATEGVLELAPAAASGLVVSFAGASGHRFVHRGTVTAGVAYDGREWSREDVAWGEGNLTGFRCEAGCVVRLAAAPPGEVGLAGTIAGGPGLARRERLESGEVRTGDASFRLETDVPEGWLAAAARADAAGWALAGGVPDVRGDARLELWNVTALLRDASGEFEIRTGFSRAPSGPVPGVQEDVVVERLVLTLRDARVEAAPGSGAILAAPRLHVLLDGDAAWPRAEGHVAVNGRESRLRGERLDLVGPALRLDADAPGAALAGVSAPAPSSALGGEATSVRIDGREAIRATDAIGGGAAGAAVGAAGLLAALYVLARTGAWAALYSRVTGPVVLLNANRRAAYDLIRARPGVHVSELARELGVGRVVLQYHLRMLETHRFVVSRSLGRVKVYYPGGGVPDATEARAGAALKDASRSRVLREILSSPEGLSQKELTARTGMSQRLVSYHLARLLELEMVEGRGARPRRFAAGPRAASPPARDAAEGTDAGLKSW